MCTGNEWFMPLTCICHWCNKLLSAESWGGAHRAHIWFCRSGQVPWLGRSRALVRKLPLLLLLDLMPIKLFSKYFLFLLPDQRCSQLWSVRLMDKALRITECWKLCPKWDLISFLPRPRKLYGGARKDVRAGEGEEGCGTLCSGLGMTMALLTPQQLWLPGHDLNKIGTINILSWRRGCHQKA